MDGATFLDVGSEAFVTLILPGTGGTVRGLVRDALGHPVAHAPGAGGPTLTEADANGFFEIDNLPLGKFTITARDTFSRATGKQEVEILDPGDAQEIAESAAEFAQTIAECAITPVAAFLAGLPRVLDGGACSEPRRANASDWDDES